jgi:hypothetical protein
VELLQQRRKEILQQAFPAKAAIARGESRFTVRRTAQAFLVAAAILLLAGAALLLRSRSNQPQLEAKNQPSQEVLRSGNFTVLGPTGDLDEPPKEIRWEKVPNAAAYQLHLTEIDHSEVWKAATPEERVELPEVIRNRIVPFKTLFVEVTAFDATGNLLETTGLVRFRVSRRPKEHSTRGKASR